MQQAGGLQIIRADFCTVRMSGICQSTRGLPEMGTRQTFIKHLINHVAGEFWIITECGMVFRQTTSVFDCTQIHFHPHLHYFSQLFERECITARFDCADLAARHNYLRISLRKCHETLQYNFQRYTSINKYQQRLLSRKKLLTKTSPADGDHAKATAKFLIRSTFGNDRDLLTSNAS